MSAPLDDSSRGEIITGETTHLNVDPTSLLPSRGDLDRNRLEAQRRLLLLGIPRATPVLVTPDQVVFDGHHMVRAAAEEGKMVEVRIVNVRQQAIGARILDLPVR